MITFAEPIWILAGTGAVFIFWLLSHHLDVGKKSLLEAFASSSLLKKLTPNISKTRRRVKSFLLLLALFCCFLALAKPQYGYRWVDVKHKGIDILFALDTSKSMLAEDILPNRLERSKLAVMDFVSQLEGDRVGLMPFAGSSYLVCPLTSDYRAFEQSLMAIDTTIIPSGGTDIGNALKSAEKILRNEANHKILILITDGEDLEGDAVKAAIDAKKQNMTVYTIGIGTASGELIPDGQNGGFLKDEQGNYVKSKLDKKSLKTIADSSGGIYAPLGNKGQGLETIYQEKLRLIPKTEYEEKRKKIPQERFGWPLTAAIILLSLEYLISGRKPKHSIPKVFSHFARRKTPNKAILVPMILFLSINNTSSVSASNGDTAYDSGNYIEAAEHYSKLLSKDPENPKLLFNSGAIAYKNNLFDEAVDAFQKSLASEDIELHQRAYYNLGNSFFRKGEQTLQADPKKTIDSWEQSLKSYNDALALNTDNEDARFNHDLVRQKLNQLKKQQESQQDNQDKKENNETKQKKNDKNDNTSEEQKKQPDPESSNQTDQQQSPKPEQDSEENKQQQKPSEATTGNEQNDNGIKPKTGNAASQTESSSEQPNREMQAMTREEAEKLLQAVQDEEGRLNLYINEQKKTNNKPSKNW